MKELLAKCGYGVRFAIDSFQSTTLNVVIAGSGRSNNLLSDSIAIRSRYGRINSAEPEEWRRRFLSSWVPLHF